MAEAAEVAAAEATQVVEAAKAAEAAERERMVNIKIWAGKRLSMPPSFSFNTSPH